MSHLATALGKNPFLTDDGLGAELRHLCIKTSATVELGYSENGHLAILGIAIKPQYFKLTAITPRYWEVAFDNPLVNVIGTQMNKELEEILTELESNKTVNVVVFESADPDFYLAHYDLAADHAATEALPSKTGFAAWSM